MDGQWKRVDPFSAGTASNLCINASFIGLLLAPSVFPGERMYRSARQTEDADSPGVL
jgi:hypothetical protein